VLYNRVGPRLLAAGSRPLPDVVDRARNVLDVSLRFPVLQGLMARVDARNLLDDRYLVTQGTVTADAYRVGRTFQVGVTWQR
jgi:outer membrane receptor protein involved in Fe transport